MSVEQLAVFAVHPEEQSVGILEMGGASLQIAFQPEGSILADKFPVKVGGTIYPIYVHSYLYYGQNYADLWVKHYLYDEREEKNNIRNPCMLKGGCMLNGWSLSHFHDKWVELLLPFAHQVRRTDSFLFHIT